MQPGVMEYFIEGVTADRRTVSYPSIDAVRKPLRMAVHESAAFDVAQQREVLTGKDGWKRSVHLLKAFSVRRISPEAGARLICGFV